MDKLTRILSEAAYGRYREKRSATVRIRPSLKRALQQLADANAHDLGDYIEMLLGYHVEDAYRRRRDGEAPTVPDDLGLVDRLREARERLTAMGYGGGAKPKPTLAEKLAAEEAELAAGPTPREMAAILPGHWS
jgi:acetylornithine deacetylase/succinyl-diaminopimelate desuccinylase-like protein